MILKKWGVVDRLRLISLLVMDVDGTMTDGDINHRRFDVHDGYGIVTLNMKKAMISGHSDFEIYKRADQLGIQFVYLGIKDKVTIISQLVKELGINYDNICYIGDDLNDLECIRVCGVGVAVHDAMKEVRQAAGIVTRKNGGHGAIRELTDFIRKVQR
jgi:3-deoxy-D-manno-octulosonate 8-phosphate phosphatase (KDO 8-P phosphatase)